MRRHHIALHLVAALAVLAGCANGSAPPSGGAGAPATPVRPAASADATAPGVTGGAVPSTLAFRAKTLTGGEFDGATLAGRPVVLWFWAPWCPTCAGQAKGVRATAEQLAGKVTVVGVGGLDDEAAMRRFVTEWKLDGVPHLSDEAGAVWKRFGVTAQSTFVLLDSSGTVAHKGAFGGDELLGRAGKLT
ncbi:peroxiredoxin family protein [Dactylosporangium sucinum]|uniref:Thiol:disulfide interchange protein n=1 Tax=Dactylosporangium sucinum TaxID=1424081 RepID=A0A917WS83_9ACTN|nr:redoxin family protein [Dactylosporangium sucinum]GGM27078.1 thiol:disulfide interchange protein [Dactylosporangium sucinum]